MEEGGSPSDTALTQAGEGVPSSGSTEWSQLGQSPAVQTHGDSLREGRHGGSGAVV